jgi:peptidoglycan/LPS O-acetylase OafA/YrhL
MSAPSERFPALDGLRGIAVVAVIFNHFGPRALPDGSWWMAPIVWFSLLGWTGVDLFFVLSGFLITGILLRHKDSQNYFPAFYAHRALRIFPLYLLLLIIFTILVPSFSPTIAQGAPFAGARWPYWLFVSNLVMPLIPVLAPAWSLAVEEQFYVSWSIAVRWLTPRLLGFIAMGLLLGGIILRVILVFYISIFYSQDPEYKLARIYIFTLTHIDGLCIGILIRLIYDRLRRRRILATFARAWWTVVIALAAILLLDAKIGWQGIHNWYQPMMLIVGFPTLALLFGAIMVHGVLLDGWVRRLFERSVLKRLGAYSYCMYLFHQPISIPVSWVILEFVGDIGVVPMLAVNLLVVTAVAHLSYVWFETPILSLKRFVEYRGAVSPVHVAG